MSNKKTTPKAKPRSETNIVDVPLDKIRVPDERITSVTPEEIFVELKDSIAEHGILQPLQLMKIGKELILVDGLHRIIAAQQMGLSTVPCIIRSGTDETLLVQNLIVNRQRGQSDPVGEGNILRALVKDHKMTLKEACRAVKISLTKARKLYSITSLPKPVLSLISNRKLAVGSAAHITQLDDPEKQLEVANDAVKWGYRVEETKARVIELLNPSATKPMGGFEFTEAGAPKPILPKCFMCTQEIQDRMKLVYYCLSCYEQVKALLESTATDVSQTILQSLPPEPTPQPYVPPTPTTGHQGTHPLSYEERARQFNLNTNQPQQPQTYATQGVNLQQLQCPHKFQPAQDRQLYCPLCNLTVTY